MSCWAWMQQRPRRRQAVGVAAAAAVAAVTRWVLRRTVQGKVGAWVRQGGCAKENWGRGFRARSALGSGKVGLKDKAGA